MPWARRSEAERISTAQKQRRFVRRVTRGEDRPEKLAVGLDVRSGGDLGVIPDVLSEVGGLGLDPKLLFFDAEDERIDRVRSELDPLESRAPDDGQ